MGKILIVEDEPGMVQFLQMELELQGYDIAVSYTGLGGVTLAQSDEFEAIFLDIMLPDMSGIEVCRSIRQTSNTPIIMLTALGAVDNRVEGLDAGADDYLVKPFAIEELMARVRALVRRGGRVKDEQLTSMLQAGQIMVQTDRRCVLYKGQPVDVTMREYELLVYLMNHPNQTFTRQELLGNVWGFVEPGDTNVVDVYIGYLRQKLDKSKQYIKTMRGIGYSFRTHAG